MSLGCYTGTFGKPGGMCKDLYGSVECLRGSVQGREEGMKVLKR